MKIAIKRAQSGACIGSAERELFGTKFKKFITDIKTVAALLMAGAAFAACSDDNITENGQPANPTGKYTMTIEATKGDASRDQSRACPSFGEAQPALDEVKGDGATTRALTLDDKTLNATWATTENVYVQKGEAWADGSLQPQADGATATLKGELSGITIAENDVLTLQFPKSGDITYDGQLGTLADIEANFDYATASVTVASISASGNINPEAATTTFTNQQAIVKFTLIDKADGTSSLSATQLVVSDGTNSYTVTPASATSEIYVAIPGFSGQTVTLTATVGTDTYTYEKSGVTFTNGQYYEITVKMTKAVTYKLLSAATAEDIGKVVCADGHLHTAKTAVPAGCTAVGILGKVTETGCGLILALQDATSQDWNTINGWTSTTTYAGTTLKVLPDAAAHGSLTSYTRLGTTAVSDWAVAQKSDYEAIFTNLGSTTGDSDGKTYDGNVNAYITTGVGGTAISGYCWSTSEDDWSGKAWTFYSNFWRADYKTTSNRVRPVLGFGPAKLLSAATTSDVGKVVCADGHLRDAKTAVPAGGTAVGILGKVTETGHGLIIALQDATSQNWNTINGWTSVTTYADTELKVLPDDAARGANLTSYTALGATAVSDWAVAQMSDYKEIFTNLGSTTGDSNGKTYDGNVNAYITTGVGGAALDGNYWSATEKDSGNASAFISSLWGLTEKTNSFSVRPVLGF